MRIRLKTLWRVPVFSVIASLVCYWVTVHWGGFFFAAKTTRADGGIEVSADPVRSLIFQGVLFLAVLLLGGLWCFRSMTKAEIAVSAAIISVIYLVVVLLQLFWAEFPVSLSIELAKFQGWSNFVASCLFKVTGSLKLTVLMDSFSSFLFVLFGKKNERDQTLE